MAVCAPWATIDEVRGDGIFCGKCAENQDEIPDEILEEALLAASEILNNLTFGDFPGICTETVRLCPQATGGDSWWWHGTIVPSVSQVDHNCFSYRSWGCGCSGRPSCGCGDFPEVDLGRLMVQSVEEVILGGEVLAPSSYIVQDYRYLARTDGGSWPCCGDLEVTLTWGSEPTAGLKRSAMVFACQLALGWCGQPCDLPANVTSVQRQGVSIQVFNPGDLGEAGITGVSIIDQPVLAYRYRRNHRGGGFSSPDRGPIRRKQTYP